MTILKNDAYIQKAMYYRRPLKTKIAIPTRTVDFISDPSAFQHVSVEDKGSLSLPFALKSGERLLLDFGEHQVGYLHYSLDNSPQDVICDSPVRLKFSFGEFPYEILKPLNEYQGTLGDGWFQREERSAAFLPHSIRLERRYAFRYLLIERTDRANFAVLLKDIFVEAVSAVDIKDALPIKIDDPQLKKIYHASLKTLKECEQDVFEDGPKRDCRLWMGDLRVQALTDYKTFRNIDLIKRCLYLLAGYRLENRMVQSCLFADSPPHINGFSYGMVDYCLFFASCLYDYYTETGDLEFVRDLYQVAKDQVEIASALINKEDGTVTPVAFTDWCPNLDKEVAFLGVYLYALRQFKVITAALKKDTGWIEEEIDFASKRMRDFYHQDSGLFITTAGQLSQHSQVWAILSGVLTKDENIALANKIEQLSTEYTMRTPFAVHYYLEALHACGLKEMAMTKIKDYWGKMLQCGYDCCPECFNEHNDFESPYHAPEINSACHAWSCTPAYWIYKYIHNV